MVLSWIEIGLILLGGAMLCHLLVRKRRQSALKQKLLEAGNGFALQLHGLLLTIKPTLDGELTIVAAYEPQIFRVGLRRKRIEQIVLDVECTNPHIMPNEINEIAARCEEVIAEYMRKAGETNYRVDIHVHKNTQVNEEGGESWKVA